MSTFIDLRGIDKSYHLGETSVHALNNLDLTLEHGEFIALSGPSGSGKSTLLNICGLLDRPDKGSYLIDGRNTAQLKAAEQTRLRREQIGFVFQNFNLVPVMNARENIEYPLLLNDVCTADRRAQVDTMLAQVGLEPYAKHLPDKLSGGQRQRVAIARALVKRPNLVIADEPTANLDTATATLIIDLMHQLGREQGATFLIATHDERMSARCDRVVQLIDGAIS